MHLQFQFTFLKFGISILEQFIDDWMWNSIEWYTTVNLTFHNKFAMSFSIMFVVSLLDDSSEYSSCCFLLAIFCKVVLLSTPSLSFSPCWAICWGLMFPLSLTVSSRCLLVSASWNLVFLDCFFYCLNHLSDLFVAGNNFACVF